ncbi:alpha/beta hydrolase [Rossellomorea oryzaecorticis]|uniref:Alpha/beta hydrolase n=1 Tax=Rossellomorea oryzaecorticis TaxID=1396505 RepID=A0ABW8VPR0_9BACI
MKKMDPAVISKNINRTIKTARLFDVFWERWIVHGLDRVDLEKARPHLHSLEEWQMTWAKFAKEKEYMARELEREHRYGEAEEAYRQTALYYNLNYWIDPMYSKKKISWYKKCLQFMNKADSLSDIPTTYKTLVLQDQSFCSGRIRIPENPAGVIIIVNPIDSSKEELYTYEMDFVQKGFITMSFDGPGQGETFLLNDVIGTRVRWESFIHHVIDFAKGTYPDLPVHLFGTSLAASWVLYGSSNKNVDKSVAISPAVELERMNMPGYFLSRIDCSCSLKSDEVPIPEFKEIEYAAPVFIFYGRKDGMIVNEEMYRLYETITSEKQMKEYEEEGHVCNFKLKEIRELTIEWFTGQQQLEGEYRQ